MKLTDEPKIFDDKIKANQARYDLNREEDEIYVLSSKYLDKYEYLTGYDLGYKLSAFEKAKFEYSPLGMLLDKTFKKDEGKNIAKKSKNCFSYDSKHAFFKAVKTKKLETHLKKEQIMKNVEELYGKYYNAYKSDYDSEDELHEAKKKNVVCKQFELVDKTDKELKLDEETKMLVKEIKEKEKGVDKKGFSEYFNYEPTTSVSKLLRQNAKDLKNSLDEIKQQKIKLNADGRNNTNNKYENDRLNMILSVIDRT